MSIRGEDIIRQERTLTPVEDACQVKTRVRQVRTRVPGKDTHSR